MTGIFWQRRIARLALAAAALVLSQTAPVVTAGTGPDLRIAGIGLSTSLAAFIERYPEARIDRFEAVRYCRGEAVAITPLQRVVGSVAVASRHLEVEFRQRGGELRAVRVMGDRVLPAETPDFAAVRADLVARHGVYDRRVVHRKMEPAGLMFGFVWRRGDSALLSVIVHRDHSADFNRIVETALLTDQLPGMLLAIEAAAQQRREIDRFHQTCAQLTVLNE